MIFHLLIIVLLFILFFMILWKKNIEGFGNLNGIDIVYWINLDRSPDRRETMEKMFEDEVFNGISNERISAVDGNNEDIVYSLFTTNNYSAGTKEYACTISHLNTIKKFNGSNNSVALILEDDATLELKKYWTKSIHEIIENAPSDWEIIMLNYIILPGNEHPFLTWKDDADYTDMLPSGTLSYIINKKGANKIIDIKNNKYVLNDDIHQVADAYIYNSAKTYCYKYPMFIYKEDNDSEINNGHNNINEYARKVIINNYEKKNKDQMKKQMKKLNDIDI